jgi:hypothetical protein
MTRRLFTLFLFAVLIIPTVLLSACSSSQSNEGEAVHMAAVSAMPDYVKQAPQRVRDAYRFAHANPDVLEQIPCYCGCGPMGHRSNYACFWQEDKSVDYHGLGCGICVDIAHDVMNGLKQGRQLAEIRAQVDADYSRFGPPTDTPLVSRE